MRKYTAGVALVALSFVRLTIAQPFQLIWIKEDETFPPNQAAQVNAILERVKTRFEGLLENDVGYARIRVRFGDSGVGPARTSTVHEIVDYTFARSKLIEHAKGKPATEQNLYEALPAGPTASAIYEGQTVENVVDVGVALSLYRSKWVPAAAKESATIVVNENETFDYDAVDGIDENAVDLEGLLSHEVCHVLGMTSFLDAPNDPKSNRRRMSLCDLFRLSDASAGGGPNAQVFETTPRMLRPNVEAVFVSLLGLGSATYRMSTGVAGDGAGAAHWKDDALFGTYIGLLDPALPKGRVQFANGYLMLSDKRALDTVGWNIDIPNVPAAPGNPIPEQPPAGQSDASLRPTVEWVPGGSATGHNTYVFEGMAPSAASRVYAATELAGSSHTIPYGVLDESTTYTWMVTATNSMGFAYSEQRFFTTRCYADCNADGTLNLSDFGCYQTKYATGDPEADCNEDGILNLSDFGCFQTRYALGCP